MNYKTVLEKSKKIEALLEDLGATGSGLRTKAHSISSKLNSKLLKKINRIGTIRNKIIHGDGYDEFPKEFEYFANSSIKELEKMISSNSPKEIDVYEIIIPKLKKFEKTLEKAGAIGKSFHEKIDSIEYNIDFHLKKRLRYIASIRNKIMHEVNYEIEDVQDFIDTIDTAIDELDNKPTYNSYSYTNTPSYSNNNNNNSKTYTKEPNQYKKSRSIDINISGWVKKIFILSVLLFTSYNLYPIIKQKRVEFSLSDIKFHKKLYEIKDIQKILKKHSYYNGAIDGIIGKGLTKAIKKFQKDEKLKEDGIIGSITYKHILRLMYKETQTYIKKVKEKENKSEFQDNLEKAEDLLIGKWSYLCGAREGKMEYKKDHSFNATWEKKTYKGKWHVLREKLYIQYENSEEGSASFIILQKDYYETDEDTYICKAKRIDVNTH